MPREGAPIGLMNVPEPSDFECRWPAEWEPHAATWVAWPHKRDTWPERFDGIPSCFAHLVRTLSQYEPVCILAPGGPVREQAEGMVGGLGSVTLYDIPTDDAWIRDYGPMFVRRGRDQRVAAVDWRFNSWGGKYPPWDRDDAVGRRMSEQLGIQRLDVAVVLEGGAIDGNGAGMALASESCLLDSRRNKTMTRRRMEGLLRRYCGIGNVIWLAGGPLAGDDTDGHVDQLARFVSSSCVVAAVEDNAGDENWRALRTNLSRLEAYRSTCEVPFDMVQLPMPAPIYSAGQRLPASYCNFYIGNRCVLMPFFDDAADAAALNVLQPLFPEREVIGIPARELVEGLGALHCVTLQQPAD